MKNKKAGMRNGKRWAGDEEFYWFRNKEKIIKIAQERLNKAAKEQPDYSQLIEDLSRSYDNFEPRKKDISNRPIAIIGIDPATKKIVHRFPSISAARKATGLSNISLVLRADRNSNSGRRLSGGFYWFKEEGFATQAIPNEYRRSSHNKKRVRCKETGHIFESISAAKKWAISEGLPASKIGVAAGGKRQTAGGLHWEFVSKTSKAANN